VKSAQITEYSGPFIHTSEISQVPPGSINSSFVWMCVCVQHIKLTCQSRKCAKPYHSDVVSLWKSITIASKFLVHNSANIFSAFRNGFSIE